MFGWFRRAPAAAPAPPPPPAVDRQSFFSTDFNAETGLNRSMRLQALSDRVFPLPTTRVVRIGDYAMDSNNDENSLKKAFRLGQVGIPEAQAMWFGSQTFIGYQLCALIAQHWLVDKACSIPARDAVRKGYKFTVNDGTEVDASTLERIRAANKRMRLNHQLVQFVRFGRIFGIRLALTVVDSPDPDYYVKPFNIDGVTPGSYRGMSQIDPYWVTPELTERGSADPAALDFYEPQYWVVGSMRIHKSHFVMMRGPEVADILKPAYLYGGLSVPQRIYERVYAAERTANEAPQLTLTKRALIFFTDVAKALANQEKFETGLRLWSHFRDNFGVKVADKDADKIEQHDTSLTDLDAVIMTQYQLVAAIANVPATKLLGTTPKGFNSTGDYETDSYHEEVEGIQANDMEPYVDRHMQCLIRSEIAPSAPFSVECTWEPLTTLSTIEQATVNKTKMETDKIAFDIGALDGMDVRKRIAADEQSGHDGLSLDVVIEPPAPEEVPGAPADPDPEA